MSLLTSSVDLDTISSLESEIPHFPSSQIEHLANLFLAAGDTVSPILLRKISPISFEVLEGHFEYLAALKAQEIDEQFTAIRAYVVPPDLEATILAQYQFLRSHSLPTATATQPTSEKLPPQPDLTQLEQSISHRLEQKLSATINQVIEEQITSTLQVFANQMTQQLNAGLLDIKQLLAVVPISPAIEPSIQLEPIPEKTAKSRTPRTTKTKESSSKPKAKTKSISSIDNDDPSSLQVLNDFNTLNFADLERKLSQFKPTQRKLAQPIYEQRLLQPDHKFQCIEDIIINVTGIKETTMKKIISGW